MKALQLLLIVAVFAAHARAQQASPDATIPPLPEGPLLKRAPDFAQWTLVTQGVIRVQQKSDSDKPPVLGRIIVTKTGGVVREQFTDYRGQSREVWHSNGLQVVMRPGDFAPVASPDSGGSDIHSVNFANTDFAGLEWISAKTFSGIQKVFGRDCMVFKGEVDPLSEEERNALLLAMRASAERNQAIETPQRSGASPTPPPAIKYDAANAKVPAVACIDLETRLPLSLVYGKEASLITRLYQFGAPPSAPLVVPVKMSEAANQFSARIHDLSRRSAAP